MKKTLSKYLAEFLGTAFLVIFGCGTAALSHCLPFVNVSYLTTALAFGIALTALIFAFGSISGCHVNPAVSLAMLIRGDISFKDFAGYVVSQFAGGIFGSLFLYLLHFKENYGSMGTNGIVGSGDFDSYLGTILIEATLTFIFVLVILRVTRQKNNASYAGFAIGTALTLVHIFGIEFTGTSVNPARSFGPALFMGGTALCEVWVFIVAPLLGAAAAALADKFFGEAE